MTTKAAGSRVQSGNTTQGLILGASILLFVAGTVVGIAHARAEIGLSLRLFGLALAVLVVVRRRSLLFWTFFAMFAGAELGVDAPHLAAQTQFIGDIFLRLIRMIVAPLILGGIVTGIAGHGELRGVGRVAVKAIVYFEIVTTVGLIIGLI
ncbi:MAG TPA: cation:dicarboxylase symporter family transporter, partial [Humisphaera sp.]|nr:cation:dicarboxylase symporter family transporter [Humisphaera sp.]